METDSTKPRTHDDDNDRVKKMAEQEMKASIEIQTRSLDASKHHRTAVQFAKSVDNLEAKYLAKIYKTGFGITVTARTQTL